MAREKFVRKHVTEEESKELFKKIEASRPASPCLAEEVARTAYEKIAEKLEKKLNKSE
ncbi:MAG: hypothetical protein J6K42_00620 [Clostridia bacterium]|nr:hypothetical protein [Clostridia bacterium]